MPFSEVLASYPAGQAIGQMRNETTVRQIFHDMPVEFADTVDRLNRVAG